ncbi:ras-related protein Rab-5A-like isoform X2 [Parasteatoda tepidariorum]|uniref:ras-related protein Rab-5A-like isoform X2 n=1 Tax=Parasteatoda tepidariorum TaxID=114398 RepID=UPI0039BD1959
MKDFHIIIEYWSRLFSEVLNGECSKINGMGNKTNRTSNITNGMDNESQPIIKLKIGVVGEAYVGKTCLVRTYITGKFEENFNTITGWDYFTKQLKVKEKTVELLIGVNAGNGRYRAFVPMTTKNAHGILLVYDTADICTFEKLREWRETMRKLAPEAIIFIIGARSDLLHKREVLFKEGQNFAKSENLKFFECSAKTGENVKEIFEQMTLRILEKKELIPFNNPVKMEIEGKSPEWKQNKYVPATRTTEEEILNGSANKTEILPQKDTNYSEDSDLVSRTEVENLIVIKDIIGTQSSSKLKPLVLNENYHPSNDEKDVIPKVEKYMPSEEEMLLEGKCPAWFA